MVSSAGWTSVAGDPAPVTTHFRVVCPWHLPHAEMADRAFQDETSSAAIILSFQRCKLKR
jgi:hypothetical protein